MGAQGSAASTGIHHFCQVWPWPRPEHTTEMAQDVGAGRRARLRKRRGQGGREGRGERKGRRGGGKEDMGEIQATKRERKEKAKTKQQHDMVESHLERPGRTKGQRHPTQPSLSAPFSLWSKEEVRNHLCCGERAAAIGQVSVCYLGPDLSWAWAAKQPWGQEISLRRGEGSGPCKVGGVRVCAPPLLAPKFSPDGPSATVPVLGCSFPEESYPSLANQPSSGAKQGDVRCASEGGAAPPERVSSLSPG